jgi:uncharacterized delta-60 repeat protein
MARQPDGKIIIVGFFTRYNGVGRKGIARINADGSLDPTFNPGTGANGPVESFALQPDGKILIGGYFTSYNGNARNYIARLNADGSLDATFNPGTGASSLVESIVLQPDGKILIGGWFTSYNGTARNRIARLNADGSLDATFNPGTGASSTVNSIALQPDGKILIGGSFTSFNGMSRDRIARLNADGSLDATFNPGTGASNPVYSFALQPDGKILIGGFFTSYNGTSRGRIARLNPDGSLDATFNPGTGANGDVRSIALQPDGKIFVAGSFLAFNGTSINNIARLKTTGQLDPFFHPLAGFNGSIGVIVQQPDGKILVGGAFTQYGGTMRNRLARLNPNGTLDIFFNPGGGANGNVQSLALQPDGKILVGGAFTNFNGAQDNYITRLNTNGTLDVLFITGTRANGWIGSIAVQPDGKILIAGDFTLYNGTPRNHIARLNADGSLDVSFDPGSGTDGWIGAMVLQPDGKILIGGEFTEYNGVGHNRIARLNSDGSLDAAFYSGTGVVGTANESLSTIVMQPDGKILIGGEFTLYNGTPRHNVARLNPNGTLDLTFDPGSGVGFTAGPAVLNMALQSDGKVLIAGYFSDFDGTLRNHIARLNADGSLDASFDPGTGVGGTFNTHLSAVAVQTDGKILIGGEFSAYDGVTGKRIARLLGDSNLGVTEELESDSPYTLYPNPSHGIFYLEAPADTRFEVYDLRGGRLMEGTVDNGSYALDLSAYSKGMYLLRVQSGNRVETRRLVRE